MTSQPETFFIEEEEASLRLDLLLARRYEGRYSRTYFQKLIDQGLVLLNGERVKKRVKPAAGDELEIEFELTPEISLTPEAIPLHVLYEDEDILVVNKPAGMVVHPAPGNWTGTFANALLYHCKLLQADSGDIRPGIVHRLDKDTSGVLIAAKNSNAQRKMIELFSLRKVHKEYLAIVFGNPGERSVDKPIGRHPVHRQKMAVVDGGRAALTHIKPIAASKEYSLLDVVIETGRTHQIRVHLSNIGYPVVGDPLYGRAESNKRLGCCRQLLHASLIRFPHPVSGKEIEVKAEPPADFTFFLEQYRLIRLS